MSKKTNLWRFGALSASLALAVGLTGCLSSNGEANNTGAAMSDTDGGDGTVTLRLATTQAQDALEHTGVWRFVEIIEEEAPWIDITYIGGPEAITPNDAAENVQSGALDMAVVSAAYYTQMLPEIEVLDLTPNTPAEDRENGVLDLLNEWHEEISLRVLGLTLSEVSYMLHFGDRWTELDPDNLDLSGWLIRGGPTQQPMLEALGAEVVNMPVGEIYTAMERGTIDGFVAGNSGLYKLGIADPVEASYFATYLTPRYPFLVNLEKWESLDERTQEALNEAAAQMERELPDIIGPLIEEEQVQWKEEGKHALVASEEAALEFQERAREIGWDLLLEREPRAADMRPLFEAGN